MSGFLGRLRGRDADRSGEDALHRAFEALDPDDRAVIEPVLPYTMTSVERLQSLVDAVRYCVNRDLPGAFAECGVWRGGSVLAMIGTLRQMGADPRDVYLFDTFEGMTEPTEHDVSRMDPPALATWQEAQADERKPWSELFDPASFNEEEVRSTLLATGYPKERLHLVRGPVEETLPTRAPGPLALLRLDTDWYESTLHELQTLYPSLAPGGVLIIDDFGHWDGCRRAVHEYFQAHPPEPLLQRIDYTGRLAIKV